VSEVKLGKYRHYKQLDYEVIGVGRHSETLEKFVIYKALYGERELWIRPLTMFQEEIFVDGIRKKRFSYVGD